jgi:hypothetical protein
LDSGAANLPDTTTPGATKRIGIDYGSRDETVAAMNKRLSILEVGQEVILDEGWFVDVQQIIAEKINAPNAAKNAATSAATKVKSFLNYDEIPAGVNYIPPIDSKNITLDKITIADVHKDESDNDVYIIQVESGGVTYRIDERRYPQTQLELAPTEKEKIIAEENRKTVAIDAVHTFMDPKNNPLVKSFESAGGRGLAGFIESMDFDWLNQTTWDTKIGRRAPKMCKVNISFAPIHDITPGLDHRGYNRAPVYPVGSAMMHTSRPDEQELISTPETST